MLENENYRILIVDDNPSIHEDFRKILSKPIDSSELDELEANLFGTSTAKSGKEKLPDYRIDSAFQGQEGIKKVAQAIQEGDPYSMAFVDMRMPPGLDGIQTIEGIWEVAPTLQIVICTAYSDYSWDETIDRLGHTDKLLILKKPFETIEVCQLTLALSVKTVLETIAKLKTEELRNMVTERTCELEAEIERRQRIEAVLLREQSELEVRASIDEVTGLQNRRAITERILNLSSQARQLEAPFSILFVDVDHFKQVNDTYGHLAGDAVLFKVASRLKLALRTTDAIGRYGGEEFIVGLINCDIAEAKKVGDRLNASVAIAPIEFEGQFINVTVSVGTATDMEFAEEHPKRLMEQADQALYLAKQNGRNRVEQFS